ncbi:hypothetical protein [Amycolatopsis sp. NPDC051128]
MRWSNGGQRTCLTTGLVVAASVAVAGAVATVGLRPRAATSVR